MKLIRYASKILNCSISIFVNIPLTCEVKKKERRKNWSHFHIDFELRPVSIGGFGVYYGAAVKPQILSSLFFNGKDISLFFFVIFKKFPFFCQKFQFCLCGFFHVLFMQLFHFMKMYERLDKRYIVKWNECYSPIFMCNLKFLIGRNRDVFIITLNWHVCITPNRIKTKPSQT